MYGVDAIREDETARSKESLIAVAVGVGTFHEWKRLLDCH